MASLCGNTRIEVLKLYKRRKKTINYMSLLAPALCVLPAPLPNPSLWQQAGGSRDASAPRALSSTVLAPFQLTSSFLILFGSFVQPGYVQRALSDSLPLVEDNPHLAIPRPPRASQLRRSVRPSPAARHA